MGGGVGGKSKRWPAGKWSADKLTMISEVDAKQGVLETSIEMLKSVLGRYLLYLLG